MDSIIEVGAGPGVSSEVLALVFTDLSKGVDACMYISILLNTVSTYTNDPLKDHSYYELNIQFLPCGSQTKERE